jgi:hypothetical protein
MRCVTMNRSDGRGGPVIARRHVGHKRLGGVKIGISDEPPFQVDGWLIRRPILASEAAGAIRERLEVHVDVRIAAVPAWSSDPF